MKQAGKSQIGQEHLHLPVLRLNGLADDGTGYAPDNRPESDIHWDFKRKPATGATSVPGRSTA